MRVCSAFFIRQINYIDVYLFVFLSTTAGDGFLHDNCAVVMPSKLASITDMNSLIATCGTSSG